MIKNKKKPGEEPLATGVTSTPGGTYVEVRIKTLKVHVFFDGTGNNRFNTEAHRKDPSQSPKGDSIGGVGRDSYENYYSNIALLFMAIKETDDVKAIYVQGAGTRKYEKDTVRGMGLGWAEAGREARIKQAFEELNNITAKFAKFHVTLNVYGFSRGASWARHFCHLVKSKKYKDWNDCIINFVGIYDTVSSDGMLILNDVEELGLDIGKAEEINYIAHITAQNDYREKFPLTPIHRAIKDGIGFECSFPGAHSNVGGGYKEVVDEKNRNLGLVGVPVHKQGDEYIDIEWFKRKGYYLDEQITEIEVGKLKKQKQYIANRVVFNNYQFITCDVMRLIAEKKAYYELLEKSDFINGVKKLKEFDELDKLHQLALSYIKANFNKKGGGYVVPMLPDVEMKKIYNQFIHNSLEYGELANGGTQDNKSLNTEGRLDHSNPKRPQVKWGYK